MALLRWDQHAHQGPRRKIEHWQIIVALVCFLALTQWRVLEQWMSGKGLGTCARKLITAISTIRSMEVITPVKRGESSAEFTERTVARPERRVAELLTRNRILGEVSPRAATQM